MTGAGVTTDARAASPQQYFRDPECMANHCRCEMSLPTETDIHRELIRRRSEGNVVRNEWHKL